MITSRKPPRTRTFLAFALVLSVLIHIFGGGLFARFHHFIAAVVRHTPDQREEDVATSDVIRLEKRTVPRPAVRHRTAPQPRPPRPRRAAAASPQRLAAEPQPLPRPRRKRATVAPTAKPEVAHTTVHAPPQLVKAEGGEAAEPAQRASRTLSAEQIAQLDRQFSKTIAATRTDLATIQQETQAHPATIKRYAMQFNGIHADMQRGEGYIHPLAMRRAGNLVYYFTHYEYMYPDGHVEQDDIPWEFVYPVNADPFVRGVRKIPLQPPPAGYRPNRQLQPILMQFFGGPPVD
ncbi:MAG: hypothetical protein ABR591_04690 [Candidatus Velthaea sp.]